MDAQKKPILILNEFFSHILYGIEDLISDERGLTTVEYATIGGVVSGMIVVAGSQLQDAQSAAFERMTSNPY